MPFPKIDNDMLNIGVSQGQIPVVGSDNKLPDSLINSGVGANQLVKLDNTGKLPPLNASQLVNLPSVAGIGWNLIQQQIIASPVSQIDFTSGIDSTYNFYKIIATDIRCSETFSPTIRFYLGGVLITSANYSIARTKVGNNDTNNNYYSNHDTNQNVSVISPTTFNSVSGSPFNNIIIDIPAPTSVNTHKMTRNYCVMVSDSGTITLVDSATVCTANTNNLTGIRFYPFSGGTLTRGTFKLYGIS